MMIRGTIIISFMGSTVHTSQGSGIHYHHMKWDRNYATSVTSAKNRVCFYGPDTAFNPLTTDDAFWRRQILATCYQLVQSVLKIGSALAERVGQGEVGGSTALADRAWRLLQLAIEKAWSALDGLLFCLLVQMGVENGPFTL